MNPENGARLKLNHGIGLMPIQMDYEGTPCFSSIRLMNNDYKITLSFDLGVL